MKQDSINSPWFFLCGVRDSGNKIFVNYLQTEQVMYDFNANLGDTIKQVSILWTHPMIVDSIDTVLITGTPKKRFFFEYPGMTGGFY